MEGTAIKIQVAVDPLGFNGINIYMTPFVSTTIDPMARTTEKSRLLFEQGSFVPGNSTSISLGSTSFSYRVLLLLLRRLSEYLCHKVRTASSFKGRELLVLLPNECQIGFVRLRICAEGRSRKVQYRTAVD